MLQNNMMLQCPRIFCQNLLFQYIFSYHSYNKNNVFEVREDILGRNFKPKPIFL